MFAILANEQNKEGEKCHAEQDFNKPLSELLRPKGDENTVGKVEQHNETHPAIRAQASALQSRRKNQ